MSRQVRKRCTAALSGSTKKNTKKLRIPQECENQNAKERIVVLVLGKKIRYFPGIELIFCSAVPVSSSACAVVRIFPR